MLLPNENLLNAVSWTLVHSVWQGLILAIFAGLAIVFTKKASAKLRYNLLSGLFLAFLISVGFTFSYEFQPENSEITATAFQLPAQSEVAVIMAETETIETAFSSKIISFFNANANTIVLIWFLIFSLKCFNIFSSLSHIYKIRNYRNHPAPDYWSARLKDLCTELKIKKHIILLESQLVKVPSVTGFFKPIILIPVGLLSNLPQDQMEAILLHELAHIRRKDYFINLLQSFAEILFFFNPGLLWVSTLIKEERENCCDDIAVGITKSKSKFIHALVSFQEYNMKQNQLAMGFGGRKNQLLERAKRIIHDNNKSLNAIEKTFLAICIIIIASFTVACTNSKAAVAQSRDAENSELQPIEAIAYAEEAQEAAQAQIEEEAERLQAEAEVMQAEAEVAQIAAEKAQAEIEIAQLQNENVLSEEEIKQIKIEGENARIEGEKARIEGEKARKSGELARIEGEKARKEGDRARIEGEKARIEGEKARKESEKYREKSAIYREKMGEKRAEVNEKRQQLKEELNKKRDELYSKIAKEGKDGSEQQRLESLRARLEVQQRKLEAEKAKVEAEIEREKYKNGSYYSTSEKQLAGKTGKNGQGKVIVIGDVIPANVDDITTKIISDLISEKVIASTENLSYKLSTSKLIVNDKEIAADVQKKLKKYLPEGIKATYYNYNLSKEDK